MTIFDFEQDMMECWNIIQDIHRLRVQKDNVTMSEDDIDNYLLGLETIYEVKFQQLQTQFEKLAKDYHTMRQEIVNLVNKLPA